MTKLRQILNQKKVTQIELAHKTGLSVGLVGRYMLDYYDLKPKDAKKIAQALGVKMEDLS